MHPPIYIVNVNQKVSIILESLEALGHVDHYTYIMTMNQPQVRPSTLTLATPVNHSKPATRTGPRSHETILHTSGNQQAVVDFGSKRVDGTA